ncbi:MAG: HAMP domain-containing histidine kinase [Candidatus Moranbacteria bacterium]|nr:HAMP domain-containing histidine kinase [Candidatus Moranbacteria bacterium]
MLNPFACPWEPFALFVLSPNVGDAVIYYSHYGPLLLALILAGFIFFTDRKNHLSQVLLGMILLVCLWIVLDMFLWISPNINHLMFVWSLITLVEFSVYIAALYFNYVFVEQKEPPFWVKLILLGLFSIPVFLIATPYTLQYFDLSDCERNIREGVMVTNLYFVHALCILLIVGHSIYGMYKQRERWQEILTVAAGLFFFLATFMLGLILGTFTEDWLLGQVGLFGLPVFIGTLAYSVARYNSFTGRIFSIQIFIFSILLLVGTQFFFVDSLLGRVLIIFTLILILVFSALMTIAIRAELKRKQDLQTLTELLTNANQQLKELDNAKTEFLSIASHQLRTPLTAIKGYISLILEGSYGEVSTSVQDVLNKLYLVNSRMVNLAEDLLNVSRIDAGRVQYNYHAAHIEKVLQEAVEVFRLNAQNKGLELKLELPEKELPEMMMDARKIQEVCSNLVDNSIKYTPQGSVTVKLVGMTDRAVITVSDTGIGIAPENKEKLFAKFVRSKETNILDVSGTGLGLYVGKNFVEAHGGRIYADSPGKDKGSVFTIELPFINPRLNESSPNWMLTN